MVVKRCFMHNIWHWGHLKRKFNNVTEDHCIFFPHFRLLGFTAFPTMSLKAFSMAPITRLSCETFFSVKKRVGGLPGEQGAPAAPRSDAALVSARWDVGVRWWLMGSSPRHVGASRLGVQRISNTSWRCRAMWWCRRCEAMTAAPEPAWPSNNAQ